MKEEGKQLWNGTAAFGGICPPTFIINNNWPSVCLTCQPHSSVCPFPQAVGCGFGIGILCARTIWSWQNQPYIIMNKWIGMNGMSGSLKQLLNSQNYNISLLLKTIEFWTIYCECVRPAENTITQAFHFHSNNAKSESSILYEYIFTQIYNNTLCHGQSSMCCA
jgi:hypothetical protein